jgi:hypothetical protein
MFEMRFPESVAAFVMLCVWVGVIVLIIRFALWPMNKKLDRIIALLESRSRVDS